MPRTFLIAVGSLAVAAVLWLALRARPASAGPPVVLWAWERAEDLRFLDPAQVAVAYLAGTVTLTGEHAVAVPRMQPLGVAPGTVLAAVVRIETSSSSPPRFTPGQGWEAAEAIAALASRPEVSTCQVDYDAPASARPFYAALLADLRRRLPPGRRLSITALASWCLGDPWIDQLPVDEAVPMLFRMGPVGREVRRRLDEGRDFSSRLCRHSAGVSTDEPLPQLRPRRRVYIFHPKPWTETAARSIIRQVRSWQ